MLFSSFDDFQAFIFLPRKANCDYLQSSYLLTSKFNRLRKLLSIFIAITMGTWANAQPISQSMVARYPALGAYSKNYVDLYSTRNNAAALALLQQSSAGIYGERRFMLGQLNLYAASVGLPTSKGGFGVHLNYFGFSLFNQMQLSLGYGMALSEKVDIGVQFNYHSVNQGNGYGKASSINASVGALFHLTEKIHVGINIYNPLSSKWSKAKDEKIAAQYSFGLGYEASDKLYISGELVKDEDLPTNVNVAIQYRFMKQFFARAGIASSSSSYFAGLGFNLATCRVDLTASYHPQLGISPGLLLLFGFGKKKVPSSNGDEAP